MSKKGRWALVLCGVAILGTPLLGHHSFAAAYLEQDLIEIEGDVVEFQFKNPHSWIYVSGQENDGKTKIYAAEWASTSRLDREGISSSTLRAGDSVRIWAAPSRDPNDNRVHLKRIARRSDGWKWGRSQGETR